MTRTLANGSGPNVSQHVEGNNLHRGVVFRDGADRAKQVLPFSAFDSASDLCCWILAAPRNSATKVA
jgi:hypothetical protein